MVATERLELSLEIYETSVSTCCVAILVSPHGIEPCPTALQAAVRTSYTRDPKFWWEGEVTILSRLKTSFTDSMRKPSALPSLICYSWQVTTLQRKSRNLQWLILRSEPSDFRDHLGLVYFGSAYGLRSRLYSLKGYRSHQKSNAPLFGSR